MGLINMTVKMDKAIVDGKIKHIEDAKSGEIGNCYYECEKSVRARCGKHNEIHWAHVSSDSSYDIETHNYWHSSHKSVYKSNLYEVEKKFGNFIADAYHPKTKTVIEYQHSIMPSQEFRNRNEHHKSEGRSVKWILDYTEKYKNGHIRITQKIGYNGKKYYAFKITHQIQSFIEGLFTFDDKSKNKCYPDVPVYFNIINRYIDDSNSKLEIIKENERIDVNYDISKYKFVSLYVEGVYKNDNKPIGKTGWGQIVLIDGNLNRTFLNEIV